MDRNEIVSYIQSMIQQFYRSNDKALNDKIANSTSFADLELTPPEIRKLIMSCEEKYYTDLGDGPYTSIQSVVDALMSVADAANATSNDDQLPPPPESIDISDMSAASENTKINPDGDEDKIVDEEIKEETKESSAEEETSQEG